MTPPADSEYIAWMRISERGLGYDLPDFPMEIMLLLMGNTGDDGISRGSEGDKDNSVIDSSYPQAEMGQAIDSDLGQGSHVHRKKVATFRPKGNY
jgi:hypothetical protein